MFGKLSLEEKFKYTVAGVAMLIATIAKAVNERYGPEGLEILQKAVEEAIKKIVPSIAAEVGIKLGEGDLADWAKVEGFLCDRSGMEWEIEVTPDRGLLRVKSCPMAHQYKRTFPDFCQSVLIGGVEKGIAFTINPNLEVRMTGKNLLKGDDCCEIICQFKPTK